MAVCLSIMLESFDSLKERNIIYTDKTFDTYINVYTFYYIKNKQIPKPNFSQYNFFFLSLNPLLVLAEMLHSL